MKKNAVKYIVLVFVFIGLLGGSEKAFANVPPEIHVLSETLTRAEFSQLPSFLQARILGGHGEYNKRKKEFKNWVELSKKWKKKIGKDYSHYHHWVLAIVYLNRGIGELDPIKRKFLLKRSVANYTYVVEKISNSNPHKPILYFYRGEALRSLDEFGEATKDYLAAIHLKKNYLPPYIRLKEIYMQMGMHGRAEEIQNFINNQLKQ